MTRARTAADERRDARGREPMIPLLMSGLLASLQPVACGRTQDRSPAASDLLADLERLVDSPDPAERRKESRRLAARRPVPLSRWIEACASFGGFEDLEPGPSRQVVDLDVLGARQRVEVFLYVPPGYARGRPAPLLLAGHGTGTTGAREHLRWQGVADRLGMLVLAPSDPWENRGWGSTPRERALQLAALRWARRRANVDENRIYVTGVSRGGHMTWDLILRHRDLFAAAAPCIGGPRLQIQGGQNNLRYLENVVDLPIRDLQGSRDDPLLLQNLHLAFDRLSRLGAADAKLIEFADRAHDFDLGAVDWAEFFAARRNPRPDAATVAAADPSERRSFWAEIVRFDRQVAVEFPVRVDAGAFSALDEAGQRAYVQDRVAERTARLAVRRTERGRFEAESRLVKRFRLLLDERMLGEDGRVRVSWQGRTATRRPMPSAAVLLEDFAERFDRTFLPVCAVEIP